VAVTWFSAAERKTELMVISQPTHWISHWDVQLRRSRKCGGRECYCCAQGYQQVLRVVVMCVDPGGRDVLLELRERHREIFDRYDSLVGLRLSVRKLGSAKNSPVEIRPLDFAAAVERDITRLVDTLGLPPLRVSAGAEQSSTASTWADEREEFPPSKEPTRST
jgi:hypothetical protein